MDKSCDMPRRGGTAGVRCASDINRRPSGPAEEGLAVVLGVVMARRANSGHGR